MYNLHEWIKVEDRFENLPFELQTKIKELARSNEQCLGIRDLKLFAPYSTGHFKVSRGSKIVFYNGFHDIELEHLPAFMLLGKPTF